MEEFHPAGRLRGEHEHACKNEGGRDRCPVCVRKEGQHLVVHVGVCSCSTGAQSILEPELMLSQVLRVVWGESTQLPSENINCF